NRLGMLVEAVNSATASDNAIVPKTVTSIDFPEHSTGFAVHPHERHAARAVERLGAKAGLIAAQLGIFFLKGKVQSLTVFGEPDATDQHIAVDAQESPFIGIVCVILWQFEILQQLAIIRIEY